MNFVRIRGAGVVVAGVAALALAGSALAATQAGPPKNPPRYGMQQGAGLGVMAGGLTIDAAADYIGVSEADLIAARHAGKSLGQIATEHGKTVAGLEQALVKAFEANLDKAVAAGRITETQATQALATFKSQVGTMVARTATGPMAGRGNGRGAGMGQGVCRGGR